MITDHRLECLTLAGAATMASEELQGRGDPRVLLPSSLSPGLFAAVTRETRRCERKWAEEACQVFEPRSPPRISGGCFCPAGAELGLEVDIKRRDLAHGGCNMLCWLFSNFWGLFPLSEVKLHACALWRKARLPQGSAGSGEELGRGGVFTANVKSSRVLILAKAGALGGFVELRALPRLLSGGKGESTAGQKCQSPCLSACLPVSHPLAYRQGGGEARPDVTAFPRCTLPRLLSAVAPQARPGSQPEKGSPEAVIFAGSPPSPGVALSSARPVIQGEFLAYETRLP